MAYTKILTIKAQLQGRVNYAANEKKTAFTPKALEKTDPNKQLQDRINYAANPDKDCQCLLETAIGCDSVQSAYSDMLEVKERCGKTDKVLGYHVIQSFAPGEVTPQVAHEIGVEFAKLAYGEEFQCIVCTHLDKKHLHNHIVLNSVAYTNGKKYRDTFTNYYKNRELSDELCRQHGLSIIQPGDASKAKSYAEWNAEKEGQTTWRTKIKAELDEVIECSGTYREFVKNLRERGYTVNLNLKYPTVKPFGKERPIRLRSLGEGYSEEEIIARILQINIPKPKKASVIVRRKFGGNFVKNKKPIKKLYGMQAVYFRYLYQLGVLPKRNYSRKRYIKDDLKKLNNSFLQFTFLCKNNITTSEQLAEFTNKCDLQLLELVDKRKEMQQKMRDETRPEQLKELLTEIAVLNRELQSFRKERGIARKIKTQAPEMSTREREINRERKLTIEINSKTSKQNNKQKNRQRER